MELFVLVALLCGSNGQCDYPVPFDDWNAKMWEGDQLKARISLMNHLLAQL